MEGVSSVRVTPVNWHLSDRARATLQSVHILCVRSLEGSRKQKPLRKLCQALSSSVKHVQRLLPICTLR